MTMVIDERADGVHLPYDSMASLIAPWEHAALAVASYLDAKIERLLETATPGDAEAPDALGKGFDPCPRVLMTSGPP